MAYLIGITSSVNPVKYDLSVELTTARDISESLPLHYLKLKSAKLYIPSLEYFLMRIFHVGEAGYSTHIAGLSPAHDDK
jgi:hypothetical protein